MSVLGKVAEGVFEGMGEMGLWAVVRKVFGHGHDHGHEEGEDEGRAKKAGRIVGGYIARSLEDYRVLLINFFAKLASRTDALDDKDKVKKDNAAARAVGKRFFDIQMRMQPGPDGQCGLKPGGGRYRPGDENKFVNLNGKIFVSMEPAEQAKPELSITVDGEGKDKEAVKKAALDAMRKELAKHDTAKAAKTTADAEREALFMWIYGPEHSEEQILAILEAVNHDALEQFVLRAREDAAAFNAEGQLRLEDFRTKHGMQPWGKAPWRR